jgi:hypothetical protein
MHACFIVDLIGIMGLYEDSKMNDKTSLHFSQAVCSRVKSDGEKSVRERFERFYLAD